MRVFQKALDPPTFFDVTCNPLFSDGSQLRVSIYEGRPQPAFAIVLDERVLCFSNVARQASRTTSNLMPSIQAGGLGAGSHPRLMYPQPATGDSTTTAGLTVGPPSLHQTRSSSAQRRTAQA